MKKLLYLLIALVSIIAAFPSMAMAGWEWEYDILDLPQSQINNQNPVKIAIIDSGIIENDYFRPYIIEGYNFLDNNEDAVDTHGHGTKVSSILVGLAEETNLNIQLMPLKTVNSQGLSSTSNVIQAIEYSIKQNVDVINMSMGCANNNLKLFTAIQNAQESNIVVVAGAGNEGENICKYPSSYDNVLSVGSINENQDISWFSNYNDKINVVAPGENIITMELDGSCDVHSGTSFSTAFVTFEVALIKGNYPELNSQQIIQIINETAIDRGEVGFDELYGNGVINYSNAINNFDKALQNYLEWDSHSDVSTDKCWKIKFNNTVSTTGNTYIMDEFYNTLPTALQIDNDAIMVCPIAEYNENVIYSLIISDVISVSNAKLKNNVRMKFKTTVYSIRKKIKMINTRNIPDEMPLIY